MSAQKSKATTKRSRSKTSKTTKPSNGSAPSSGATSRTKSRSASVKDLPIETVGERIKRLRLEAGLSQRQLAEEGATYAYISRIEAGTRVVAEKALRLIAPKLGVTVHYLEGGDALAQCPHCGHTPGVSDFIEGFEQGWERAWLLAQAKISAEIEELLTRT